ncbi:hypothetical protein [Cyclobacterium marinum]
MSLNISMSSRLLIVLMDMAYELPLQLVPKMTSEIPNKSSYLL